MPGVLSLGAKAAEVSLLLQGSREIGVLVRDPDADRLFVRVVPSDDEYIGALQDDLVTQARRRGAADLLRELEDCLSNEILISDPEAVETPSFTLLLNRVYAQRVVEVPVAPFRTHLPLWTFKVACGLSPEDRAPAPDDAEFVEAPQAGPDRFLAPLEGRSMEPRYPDGSIGVFRFTRAGSHHGKRVLVEWAGALENSSRYSLKQYLSEKTVNDDGTWEHSSVRLRSLNPEIPDIVVREGECRIVAELLDVLE